MHLLLKLCFLSTIVVSIHSQNQQNVTKNDKKPDISVKSDGISSNQTKSEELLTSDQNFNYDYIKQNEDSFEDNYGNNGKSFLKEVHYFHDREIGYEKKRDFDSDREFASKKAKKDLYNKRKDRKSYGLRDELIEVKKWDDHEVNGHYDSPYNGDNNYDKFNRNDGNDANDGYRGSDDKKQIRIYTEINPKNNDFNYDFHVIRDDNSYNRNEGVPERGSPYREHHKQKWFTNFDEDKDQSSSIDIEVKDEDNYNNFNSPKFRVNFQNFRPWDRIMRNRRHEENYERDRAFEKSDNDLDIYVDDQNDETNEDNKYNYKPKLLTNLNRNSRHEKNGYNYVNYDKRKDKDIKYKTPVLKEGKGRPKNMRYHYEKRVPQTYSSVAKEDRYNERYPTRDQNNRKFIERPYDVMNTGWSSDQKQIRERSDRTPTTARVRQYRYGF